MMIYHGIPIRQKISPKKNKHKKDSSGGAKWWVSSHGIPIRKKWPKSNKSPKSLNLIQHFSAKRQPRRQQGGPNPFLFWDIFAVWAGTRCYFYRRVTFCGFLPVYYVFRIRTGRKSNMTSWKIQHEWNPIEKWWFSNVMLVYRGCKISKKPTSPPPSPSSHSVGLGLLRFASGGWKKLIPNGCLMVMKSMVGRKQNHQKKLNTHVCLRETSRFTPLIHVEKNHLMQIERWKKGPNESIVCALGGVHPIRNDNSMNLIPITVATHPIYIYI